MHAISRKRHPEFSIPLPLLLSLVILLGHAVNNCLSAQPVLTRLLSADTVWSVGVYTGPPEQEFGEIAGGAFDQVRRAYFLDVRTHSVRVFDHDGAFVAAFGRTGRGPGELSAPRSIRHRGDSILYILDMDNGLLRFRTESQIEFHSATRLNVRGSDFCFLGDRIFVFGEVGEHTVHEVSESGQLLHSFGEPFGPAANPVRRVLSRVGRLACIPEPRMIVAMSSLLPVVRAYDADDGQLLWTDSLPSFKPIGIQLDPPGAPPGAYAMLEPIDGFDQMMALHVLPDGSLAMQSRRAPSARRLAESDQEPFEVITTCVRRPVEASTVCVTAPPLILTVGDSYALTVESILFPRAHLLRFAGGP